MKSKLIIFNATILFTIITLILITSITPLIVGAENNTTVYPFDYELELPANQNPSTTGYFDLNGMNKGDTQKLSIKVRNNLNEPLTIDIISFDCYSNPQGDLLYAKEPATDTVDFIDPRFKLSDKIVASQNKLVLSAGESQQISIQITVPDIEFGEVLGAINFSCESKGGNNDIQTTANDNASFNIKLRNAITIAIKANLKIPTSIENPAVNIRDAGFNTNTGMAYIGIENKIESINNDVTGDFVIVNGNEQIVSKGDIKIVKMAPKTYARYPVQLNSNAIEPGNYKITVNLKSHGNTISKIMNFDVSKNDIKIYETNMHPPTVTKTEGIFTNPTFITILITLMITTIISLIIFIYITRHNRQGDR